MAGFVANLLLKMPLIGRPDTHSKPAFEMQEVMMRLDAKSAARSRCVSRSWKNYIEDMSSRNLFIIWKGLPLLLIWLD